MKAEAVGAAVTAFRALGESLTEVERAVEETHEDTNEIKAGQKDIERRVTSVSTEMRAVQSDLSALKTEVRQGFTRIERILDRMEKRSILPSR